MDSAVIGDYWEFVRQADRTLLADTFLPLPALEDCLRCYGLLPLPPLQITTAVACDIHSAKPAFKNVNEDILVSLRRHTEARTELASVSRWAEKLLRFCELRHRSLRQRAAKVCGSQATAQLRLLHLAAFLMDQFFYTKDLRLLNTVLKLADWQWILDEGQLKRGLRRTDGATVAALLQFRMLLTTEYALHQLSKGAMA